MTTRILIIADTHVPRRARVLPDAVRSAARSADLLIHAGDWVSAAVLDELESLVEVVGVLGI